MTQTLAVVMKVVPRMATVQLPMTVSLVVVHGAITYWLALGTVQLLSTALEPRVVEFPFMHDTKYVDPSTGMSELQDATFVSFLDPEQTLVTY